MKSVRKLIAVLLIVTQIMLLGIVVSSGVVKADSLVGKKVLVDGDSIAAGAKAMSNEEKPYYSYADYLRTDKGMNVNKIAVYGARFYSSESNAKMMMSHLTSNVKQGEYDYILLEGGSNDVHHGWNDIEKTYVEFERYLKEVINNKKWEKAKIGFVIPPHPNYERKGYDEEKMSSREKEMWNRIKSICKKYSIEYIDFYDKDYLIPESGAFDGLHPTKSVQTTMGKAIASWMLTLHENNNTITNSDEGTRKAGGDNGDTGNDGGNSNSKSGGMGSEDKKSGNDEKGNNEKENEEKKNDKKEDDEKKGDDNNKEKTSNCDDPKLSDAVKEASGCGSVGSQDRLAGVIQTILLAIIGISGLVAVAFVVVGGINYMTSKGDTAKTEKGKKTIIYALIGLGVCALAFVIVNWTIGIIAK